MEKSLEPILTPEEKQDSNLNRRELLKILTAAGGGLAAAAFLPGKWLKPVVEAGVLPAHAQVSRDVFLSSLMVDRVDRSKQGALPFFSGFVQYEDKQCKVSDVTATLTGSTADGSFTGWDDISRSGGSCTGSYSFHFYSNCNTVFSTYLTVNGRSSAPVSKLLCGPTE